MKLVKVIIQNFRGYNGEHIIEIEDDLTALVGKNDAGKSTVLEALEIFFGDSKPELEDLNIHCADREIAFGCIFEDLPEDVTVDTSAKCQAPLFSGTKSLSFRNGVAAMRLAA